MTTRRSPDAVLLAITALLTGVGIVMVFSASSAVAYTQFHDAAYYLKRELIWAVIGAVALVLGMRLDYTKLRPAAPWIFGIAVVLLAAVLIPSLGSIEGGARRWLGVGPFSFEPSEFAKLALVLFVARLVSARADGAASFTRVGFPVLFWVGVCFALVMRQPDLGTASIYLLTAFVMLFAAGARLEQLLIEAAVAIPAMLGFIGAVTVLVLFLAFAYRGIRIAMRADDRFGFYLGTGITASIALQALINIGVVTSSWPVTGVPLPFISYGGTSLVITLFSVGLLASVSRGVRRPASSMPLTRAKAS